MDGVGHDHGPDAPELDQAIRSGDRWLGKLLSGIEGLPHGERIYVVVVSDHGMAQVEPRRQVILSDVLAVENMHAVPLGPAVSLHTNSDETLATATRDRFNAKVDADIARAYLTRDAPLNLNLRGNRRFGDVILLPSEGVVINLGPQHSTPAGMHGWDPMIPSMKGVFLARGPRIVPGQHIPAFESIHIYPFLTEILRLTPNSNIDGDPAVLAPILDIGDS